MAMGSKVFESPLIGHARMRAMYRALVEVRTLAEFAKGRSLRGVEACWVGTAIDLADGDLTSDADGAHQPLLLEHVRAVGRRPAGGAIRPAEWNKVRRRIREENASASFPGNAFERILCAAGAAMALQAAGAQGIALAYAGLAEMSRAQWKRVLTVIAQPALPLILVVLPAASNVDLEAVAAEALEGVGGAIPVIPVDAGDAVAIYRVTQETIVRARAGGGAAALLGVSCGTDAVQLLGTQLVRKRICTTRWVDGVGSHLKALPPVL